VLKLAIFVVSIDDNLLLKVVQSAEDKNPLFPDEAVCPFK
jgi:hypothetical protein